MKSPINILLVTIFLCNPLFEPCYGQKVIGTFGQGVGILNLANGAFKAVGNYNPTEITYQGSSTFDYTKNRYFFTTRGVKYDTLVMVDATTGNLLDKITYPQSSLINPEYDPISNSLIAVYQKGVGIFNLTSKTFNAFGPYNNANGSILGYSSIDCNNRYYFFYTIGDRYDSIFVVNIDNGNLVKKITYPKGGLGNPEFVPKYNALIGICNQGIGMLDLTTFNYTVFTKFKFGGASYYGYSTFDSINNRYFFTGFGSQYDTLYIIDADSGGLVNKIAYPKGGLGNPEFFTDTCSKILVTNTNAPICEGQDLQLLAKPSNLYFDAVYKWTGPNGYSSSNESNVIFNVTPNQSGNYFLIRKNTQGCIDTSKLVANVNPSPKVGFTQNSTTDCFNDKGFILHDTSTIQSGSITRTWDFGDGTYAYDTLILKRYMNIGSHIIKLTVTSAVNCSNEIEKSFIVYPNTTIGFKINQDVQCLQNHFIFSDSSTISNGSYERTWNFSNGLFSDSAVKNASFLPGSYTIQLNTISNHGCRDSLQKNVQVLPYPKPEVGYNQNNLLECLKNNHFLLNDTSLLTSGLMSRKWMINDSIAFTVNNPETSFVSPGKYTIKLRVTSDHGCSDSLSKLFTVFPQPLADFSINNPIQCLIGNNFLVIDKSITNNIAYKRVWNFGDMNSDTNSMVSKIYSASGEYKLSLKINDSNSCFDSSIKTVIVKQNPIKPIITDISTISLKSTSSTKYAWYLNDSIIPNSNSQILFLNDAGFYKVRIDSTNGCSNYSDHLYKNPNIGFIRVFPNPSTGPISIDFYTIKGEKTITVFDLQGKLIDTYYTSNSLFNINLDNLSSAIYLLRITTTSKQLNTKVLIAN